MAAVAPLRYDTQYRSEQDVYLDWERKRRQHQTSERTALVLELREVWTAKQRRRMKEFELESTLVTEAQLLGMAMVVPNAIVRGAITANLWLASPPHPTPTVASPSLAYDSVSKWLAVTGLPAPDTMTFAREASTRWPRRSAEPGQGMVMADSAEMAT